MATDDMPRHWYEDYERGRPGYPEQVVDLAELAPSATALELAAGMGKFTRQLVSRIAHVMAVEPDPGMRRLLVTRVRDWRMHPLEVIEKFAMVAISGRPFVLIPKSPPASSQHQRTQLARG